MKLKLTRIGEHDESTFGILTIDGRPMFVTCELPWLDNQHDVSCIPKGKYSVVPHESFKFGKCYEVIDVPDRGGILFHAGNTHVDTHGCILLGIMFGKVGDKAAILSSRAAVASFLVELGGKEAELEIV
jgi:hypothetical protein